MSNKKTFQVAAQVTSVSTLVDGGMAVRFRTQEMTPEAKLQLMEFLQSFGWLLFRSEEDGEFREEEVPKESAGNVDEKPVHQRLRGVLFLLWKKQGQQGDFNVYYKQQMERLIEAAKQKLD